MKDEYDLKRMKKRSGKIKVDSSPKVMISIRIEGSILSNLKDEADSLGIGYQTLISNILKKHVVPETISFEDKIIEKVLNKLEKTGLKAHKKKHKAS